jgi:hypothetical protein
VLKRPSFPRRCRALFPCATFAVVTIVATPRGAAADPQLTAGLSLGVAGLGDRSDFWSSTGFAAGLRGELLFGRTKDESVGVGPYVETLTTDGFSDIQLGGGAALLVPIHPYLPVVVSAGAYAGHRSPWGWEPGLAGELFWGTHGYNYHSLYSMSAGIFAGGRYALGDSKEVTLLAGGRIDLELIAIPFLFVWGAIRGPDPSR